MLGFLYLMWWLFGVPICLRVAYKKGWLRAFAGALSRGWKLVVRGWVNFAPAHLLCALLCGVSLVGGGRAALAQAPTVTVTPATVGGELALTVVASGPALGDVWVSLPTESGAIGHNSWNGLVSSGSMYFSPADLGSRGAGTYPLSVRVYDQGGQFTDTSVSYTVDASPYTYTGAPTGPQQAPGDLSIGIPGLGAITLPTGWFSQIVSYGEQLAQFYTGMTSAGLSQSFQTMLSQQLGLSTSGLPDVNTMMQKATHDLFAPDPAGADQMKADASQFVDWGPVSYLEGFQGTFTPSWTTTPAPPDTHTDINQVLGPAVSYPGYGSVRPLVRRALPHGLRAAHTDTNGTGSGGPMAGMVSIPLLTVSTQTGQWSDTGATIPFDFTAVTNSPVFQYMRTLLGGSVYLIFVWVVYAKTFPKPTY